MTRFILLLLLILPISCASKRPAADEATAAAAEPLLSTGTEDPEQLFSSAERAPESIAEAAPAQKTLSQSAPAGRETEIAEAGNEPIEEFAAAPATGTAPATTAAQTQEEAEDQAPMQIVGPEPVSAPYRTAAEAVTETEAAETVGGPVAQTGTKTAAETLAASVIQQPSHTLTEVERRKQRFLPTRRRMDREINKIKFAYKGEVMTGLTASYGTLSSDDTDFMLVLDNINASGTIATVKPFAGYFYRDNNCVGVRFGYTHVGGTLDKGALFDLGESNDVSLNLPYLDLTSDNYSFGIFHRSYAGLDPKGRFGLFAEFELAVSTGSSEFSYESNGEIKHSLSDNTQVKLSFNPGAAVYIFPNVCATLSFGLGGIQYTNVTQRDAEGNKIGSRKASNMKFKLNIAAINIGMTIHLWDKKKR
ncbi:hypothetical protein [Alistipes sp.]|uniref:hypothetical protein n=1 Tax=Alistipes sp. TaxID=1872444 RepID=UPI003AF01FA7